MTLRSGLLGGEAQLRYGAAKQKPALEFAGNIHVEKLHTVDNDLQDDFINWERLDVLGLNYQQAPDRLDIAEIVARKPYARVIIESDSTLNVKRVLTAPGAAANAQAAPAAQRGQAGCGQDRRNRRRRLSNRPRTGRLRRQPMPMSIKKITMQGGQANFTDLSVTPNFSAGIQNLQGTVLGLSSKPNSRAKVDLHGEVDTFSPVTITGEVNVLSAALYTDLAMSFRNMELSIFNPYSGKFAGYNITKGKLTTEMHYKVEGRKLDAQHHIVIDQLEFGAKTASKEAVSLPIKLAVALLKDRNGVIDLNLPVGGSLDDPSFRLAPIIWKVFVNILEKAVTAPFALFGALFGGGPELQFIDFKPGAGDLEAAAADKIKTVAKAMKERPQLKIDLPIAVVPDIDRPALVAAKFAAQLQRNPDTQGRPQGCCAGCRAARLRATEPRRQARVVDPALCARRRRRAEISRRRDESQADGRRGAGQNRFFDLGNSRARDRRRRRTQGAGRAARDGDAGGIARRSANRPGAGIPGCERQGRLQGRPGALGAVAEIGAAIDFRDRRPIRRPIMPGTLHPAYPHPSTPGATA